MQIKPPSAARLRNRNTAMRRPAPQKYGGPLQRLLGVLPISTTNSTQPLTNSGIAGRHVTADIFDKEVNVTRFADPIDPLTPVAEVNVVHFAEPFPPVTETCCSAEAPHQFDDQVPVVETLVPAQALATTVRTMLPKAPSGPHTHDPPRQVPRPWQAGGWIPIRCYSTVSTVA